MQFKTFKFSFVNRILHIQVHDLWDFFLLPLSFLFSPFDAEPRPEKICKNMQNWQPWKSGDSFSHFEPR